MRNTFLVCYDVCDDKRLRKVFKAMRDFGDHLQYSVFRCELSDRERIELIEKLTDVVKHDADQVLFFSLGPVGGQREQLVYTVGLAYKPTEHGAVIV